MDARTFKDRLTERFAAVGRALASPKRVELIELLAQTERTVNWLAGATGTSAANASQHLGVLREARLVESRREGPYVHYRLASPTVHTLLVAARAVAEERDAEVDRLVRGFFSDRDAVAAVGLDELCARLVRGDVVVLDVRPVEEFAAAHVPGARSTPLAVLDPAAVPRDRLVVAYCRGPYCVFADEAVARLRAAGIDARRLDGGLPEWRAAGYPIASGEA